MGTILDKFGIYDLVAVLLSGICISTFSILVLQIIYKVPIDATLQINETLSFIVLSYFLGLIFQEIGSFIQRKIINKNDRLLKSVLNTSSDSLLHLTETEKNGIFFYVTEKLELNPEANNDSLIYNYCKFYIIKNNSTTRIDRDQSLSAMSRSLSLYFAVLTFILFISVIIEPCRLSIIFKYVSLFLTILLGYRNIRFSSLRYVYIFRAFYYNVVKQ